MISFTFQVNPSFLEYPNHPVTIPENCYDGLREEGCASENDKPGDTIPVVITNPTGRSYEGWIYYGKAGYNFYYQIKVGTKRAAGYCGRLEDGDVMPVMIKRVGNDVRVYFFDITERDSIIRYIMELDPEEREQIVEELKRLANGT